MHSKVKINSYGPALLKSSCGKCVFVQSSLPSQPHQLVAEKVQENDPEDVGKVTVYDISYKGVQCMAFRFELEDKAIFPVVTDGKEIKFEELPKQNTFKKKFLFQWGDAESENWRSLKSVAKPSMYLFVEDNITQMARVTIQPFEMPHFKVYVKGREAKTQKFTAITSSLSDYLVSWDLNQGPSCRAATVVRTKSRYRPKRKNKKMKTFEDEKAECFSEVFTNEKDPDQSASSEQYFSLRENLVVEKIREKMIPLWMFEAGAFCLFLWMLTFMPFLYY